MIRRNARVLILDDEPDMIESLELILKGEGYETLSETEGTKALQMFLRERPDLVITDLKMAEMDGLTFLEKVKAANAETPVILLTGFATVDSAVEAMKKGASDYLSKPFSPEELLLRVGKVLAWGRLQEENRYLRQEVEKGGPSAAIIGKSPAFLEVLRLVDRVAETDARVLVVGESGTGKELIARTLHRRSLRREAPFFAVNCGALTETLLESELFGHERGSFTGAVSAKKGIFEVADGGTLFLDEITETSLAFQTKLLRVVEEGEFLRVGATRPLRTDVRLITSSNRDLKKVVTDGRFREDLYYRLRVFQIGLPSLKERLEDIPLLADHFLAVYSRQIKKKVQGISPRAMDALLRYSWPGNIRELENVIERAIIMAEEGDEIMAEDLPSDLWEEQREQPEPMDEVRETEREVILRALRECQWNRSLAAKKLGIGRRTLYDKLARLRISLRHSPLSSS